MKCIELYFTKSTRSVFKAEIKNRYHWKKNRLLVKQMYTIKDKPCNFLIFFRGRGIKWTPLSFEKNFQQFSPHLGIGSRIFAEFHFVPCYNDHILWRWHTESGVVAREISLLSLYYSVFARNIWGKFLVINSTFCILPK